MKNIFLFLFLLMATAGLQAQNGNAVISEVKLYNMGDGTGVLTVRVSGNLAYQATGGTFVATGDIVRGGRATGGIGDANRIVVESPGNGHNNNGNGNQAVILTGSVPLGPTTGQGPDFVDIDLSVSGDGRVFWHWSFPVTTTNP